MIRNDIVFINLRLLIENIYNQTIFNKKNFKKWELKLSDVQSSTFSAVNSA